MPLVRAAAVTTEPETPAGLNDAEPDRGNDVERRRAAVKLAVRAGEAESLAARFHEETDAGLREAILTGLVRIGGVRPARALIELLRDDDALQRNAVIETLQCMGDSIIAEIERLLDEDDPNMRIYAVNILQGLRSSRTPDLALRLLATDPDVNVCATAVDLLAEVGRPDMVEDLAAVVHRFPHHPFLGFAVRAAIKRLG